MLRIFSIKIFSYLGVLIYVNNVERGQPEVYVVLEEAQIGVRIRESYSMDIDRLPQYQESMGMLDIQLSVPPQVKLLLKFLLINVSFLLQNFK